MTLQLKNPNELTFRFNGYDVEYVMFDDFRNELSFYTEYNELIATIEFEGYKYNIEEAEFIKELTFEKVAERFGDYDD
jgi:mannosyltransferase OCH1-like enzyme